MARAEMLVGVAKVDITYRTGPVNDPCFAKALVLKNGETTAVLITVDAVSIGEIGRVKIFEVKALEVLRHLSR